MNWLAHVFLSELDVDCQIGNFLADPLKGRAFLGASEGILKGMALHKRIDTFTDKHQKVIDSKAHLAKSGLLRGVVVDMTYDYLLTKHWKHFSYISLESFLKQQSRAPKICPKKLKHLYITLLFIIV